MAYKRKPNYHFATKTATGIDNVPVGRIIIVEDYDGIVKIFVLDNITGLTGASTIEQAVAANNLITELDDKQDNLISGTNIKTVNGTPVLGSGNIAITSIDYDAAHSFGTNGYQKLENGLIIQWYNVTADGTYSWPIAFTTACYSASATLKGVPGTATNTHNGVTATATQFVATTGVDSTNSQFIIGIGY